MIRLIIFAVTMLLLSSICNGQGRISFGASRAQDTSFTIANVKFTAYGGSLDTMLLIVLPNGDVKKAPFNGAALAAGYGLVQVGDVANVDTTIFFKQGGNDFGISTAVLGSTSGSLDIIAANDTRLLVEANSIKVFNVDSFLIHDDGAFRAGHIISDGGVKFSNYPNSDILGTDANGELVDNSAILDTFTSRVFPLYDATRAYIIGNVVQGTDSNIYRAITSTTGNNPVTNSGAQWELYAANTKLTLNVPSRFASISTAWAFLKNAKIPADDTVTIQLANGTYNEGTTTHNLNHPYGSKIQIMGNRESESSVIVRSAYATSGTIPGQQIGLFYVTNGNSFGLIDGVTLKGPGNSITEFAGVASRDGSSITVGTRVAIDSFYFSLFAYGNAHIRADSVVCRYGGDGNVFSYGSSHIDFVGGASSGAYGHFAKAGAVVEFGASLFALGASFTNNAGDGIYITNKSSVNCNGCTISSNGGYGVRNDGGSIDQTSITFSGNVSGNRYGSGAAEWYSSNVQYTIMGTPVGFGSHTHTPTNSVDAYKETGDATISAESASGGRGKLLLKAPTGNDPVVEFHVNGALVGGLYYRTSNSSFNLYESGADRLVIKSGRVGIGATSPAASAQLEVSSTTGGILFPRMTATQASAIGSPADGLMIYVTSTNGTFTSVGFWGREAGAWVKK